MLFSKVFINDQDIKRCCICNRVPENATCHGAGEEYSCAAHKDVDHERTPSYDFFIDQQEAACVFTDDECSWRGKYKDLNDHVREEHIKDVKDFSLFPEAWNTCPYRGCIQTNTYHIPVCPLRPLLCFVCSTVIPFEEMKAHVERHHTETVVLTDKESIMDVLVRDILQCVKYATTQVVHVILVPKTKRAMTLSLDRDATKSDFLLCDQSCSIKDMINEGRDAYSHMFRWHVTIESPPTQKIGRIKRIYYTEIGGFSLGSFATEFHDDMNLQGLAVRDSISIRPFLCITRKRPGSAHFMPPVKHVTALLSVSELYMLRTNKNCELLRCVFTDSFLYYEFRDPDWEPTPLPSVKEDRARTTMWPVVE